MTRVYTPFRRRRFRWHLPVIVLGTRILIFFTVVGLALATMYWDYQIEDPTAYVVAVVAAAAAASLRVTSGALAALRSEPSIGAA
jgi:hypothetical protein